MNQILDYNPNKNPGGGSSGSDKVVRVFAIILAIFAICLLGGGAYGLYKNSQAEASIPTESATDAQITVEQKESTAVIKVTHDKVIEKLIYSWDAEKETTIKGSGESTMEEEIALFAGEHTLNVKVVDVTGHETSFEQSITSENGEDKIYPVIELNVTDDKKLEITATDETALDFVTYRWNDEEEQRVDATEEDNKTIKFEIDILKGNNDITIVAVDKNSNTTTEIQSFSGLTEPDVTITISADKTSANVKCYHENGIKEIKLKVNEQDIPVDLGGETPTDANFDVPLEGTSNNIVVTAISIDNTSTEVSEQVQADEQDTENQDNSNIEITIEKSESNPDKAFIKGVCSDGIKEVKLNVNDVDIPVDLGGETPPEMSFEYDLVDGNNRFTLTIISVNGEEKQEVKEITK